MRVLLSHFPDRKLRWVNLPKQVVELGFGHCLTPEPLFLIITLTYHYPYDISIKPNRYIKDQEVQ